MTTKELKWRMEFDDIDDFLEKREELKRILMKFTRKHNDLRYNMDSEFKNSMFSISIEVESKTLSDGEIIGELG